MSSLQHISCSYSIKAKKMKAKPWSHIIKRSEFEAKTRRLNRTGHSPIIIRAEDHRGKSQHLSHSVHFITDFKGTSPESSKCGFLQRTVSHHANDGNISQQNHYAIFFLQRISFCSWMDNNEPECKFS